MHSGGASSKMVGAGYGISAEGSRVDGVGYDVYGAGPGTDGAGFILGLEPAPTEQRRKPICGAGFGCVLEPAPFMSGTCTI